MRPSCSNKSYLLILSLDSADIWFNFIKIPVMSMDEYPDNENIPPINLLLVLFIALCNKSFHCLIYIHMNISETLQRRLLFGC